MDFIKVPFGYLMEWCCKLSPNHNYLIALAFFTLILQVILCFAFGIKQQKNSVKQAMLAPKVTAIRKKYAGRNDQQTMLKMNEETQALYTAHGYSPYAGCLPMLIQLPVIMGLYYVITEPLRFICGVFRTDAAAFRAFVQKFVDEGLIESTNARTQQYEILKHITNPENADGVWKTWMEGQNITVIPEYSVDVFGRTIDLSIAPQFDFTGLWIVLALILVTSIGSQMLTRKFTYQDPMMKEQQNNCSMKVMMYSMPLMSVFIAYSLPAAVGVYWIYRSVAATLQQFILSRVMPYPKFTEEDYKKAEEEMKGKNKNKKKKEAAPRDPNAPKKRSLHHIDDEEDEAPAVEAPKEHKTVEEKKIEEATEEKKSTVINGAPVMKEDKGSKYKKK